LRVGGFSLCDSVLHLGGFSLRDSLPPASRPIRPLKPVCRAVRRRGGAWPLIVPAQLQHVPTAMNRDSQDTPEVRV